jgi:hypothetical protein
VGGEKMSVRQSFAAKVAAVAVVLLALLVGSSSALADSASPRAGALHVTKECSEYQGQPGGFCTITSSNIPWIRAGMRVVYEDAPNFTTLMLDTDVVLSAGHGSAADGHVTLNLVTAVGTVTLDGGTGAFRTFHCSANVTVDGDGVWHWDGTYSFGSDG